MFRSIDRRSSMNVFMTGATGYIGSAVVQRLLAGGHSVTGLARSDESALKLARAGVTPQKGDLGDLEILRAAASAADGVIHAGMSHDDWSRMDEAFERDQLAVDTMLEALAGSDKPFIYTSGSGVLVDTGADLADESAPTSSEGTIARRVSAESAVLEAAKSSVRTIVLRPGLVYGHGGSGVVHMMIGMAREAGHGRTVGQGQNAWSAVHIEDLADAYVRALTSAPPGTLLHVASGEPVEMRALAGALSRGLGQSGDVEGWPLSEARQQLGVLADGLAAEKRIDASRARHVLGWNPVGPSLFDEIAHGSYEAILSAPAAST
jgi:nucleoside-diphosphate-sugar epimerase